MTGLAKPPHGAACNHCGLCCIKSVCRTGQKVLGVDAAGPCPALIDCGDEKFCGMMARPQDYLPRQAKIAGIEPMRKAAQLVIGSGLGCCARFDDEPRDAAFDRRTAVHHKTMSRKKQVARKILGIA
jgi:predicted metal-binding transcription factor (methanogenesis marker protein 9)